MRDTPGRQIDHRGTTLPVAIVSSVVLLAAATRPYFDGASVKLLAFSDRYTVLSPE